MSFQELGLGLSSISTLDRAMDRFLLALDLDLADRILVKGDAAVSSLAG